jgi:glycosyltransferase involved in cell wall biosynthesis
MRSAPLVSVIVPFLNEEQFLSEAVDSVLAQSYEAWELVLADDGSSDSGAEIAKEYAAQDPTRIRYVTHVDGSPHGLSATRNLGVSVTEGEFIAFLDADDIWVPRKLEEQVAILAAQPEAAMAYGPTLWWYGWNGDQAATARDKVHAPPVEPDTLVSPPSLIEPFFAERRGDIPSMSSAIFRRTAIEYVGGWEESFPGLFEDQVVYAKLCAELPVYVASECWDRRRQRPDSITGRATPGEFDAARLRFLAWLIEYLEQRGQGHTALCTKVRRRRFRLNHPRLGSLARMVRGGP